MSAPENPNQNDAIGEIPRAIESLRTMFHLVALCGIMLSASFFLFLYKQVSGIKRQNAELKTYVQEYNDQVVPKVEVARTNLEAFAKANPTIVPLLQKYFSSNAPAAKR